MAAFFKKVDEDLRKQGVYVEDKERATKEGHIIIKEDDKSQKDGKATLERIPTGIPGFDELVEGGLKKNSIILVEGGAGTGKSIFSTQFLVNGATKYDEPGIYISFEEEKDEFFANMSRFGFDLYTLEKEKKILYYRYMPEQVEKVISSGGGNIRDAIESIGAKRIVFDSITAFTLLHDDELSKREAILNLFRIIKKWGCTTLVIGQPEMMMEGESHSFNILEFECDGVIRLYHEMDHNIRHRLLEVYKMRGTKHAEKMFTIEIAKNGIVVYPQN